jgi:hypothetical protein
MPQDITLRIEVKSGPRLYLAGALGLLSKWLDRKALELVSQSIKPVIDGK